MTGSNPATPWYRRAAAVVPTHPYLKGLGTTAFISMFFVAYFYVLRHPASPPTVMPVIWLDRLIGFQPLALPVYLSLWLYVSLLPAFLATRPELSGMAWPCRRCAPRAWPSSISGPRGRPLPTSTGLAILTWCFSRTSMPRAMPARLSMSPRPLSRGPGSTGCCGASAGRGGYSSSTGPGAAPSSTPRSPSASTSRSMQSPGCRAGGTGRLVVTALSRAGPVRDQFGRPAI